MTVTAPATPTTNTSGLATGGQVTTTQYYALGALAHALIAAVLAAVAAMRTSRASSRASGPK